MKQIISNVYDDIFKFENLLVSDKNAAKCKRYRSEILYYHDDLESKLFDLESRLLKREYVAGKYRQFYVREPKIRKIMALSYEDRIVQWAIYSCINPFYDKLMIEDSYACRLGKGREKCVEKLEYWLRQEHNKEGRTYYLKLDISKYFYRIDHEILIDILRQRIKDEDLINILTMYINCEDTPFGLPEGMNPEECPADKWLYDVGMPIGNLLSQLFANVYLNELDQFCKHVLKIHKYERYMDDVLIISNDKNELKFYLIEIEKFLASRLALTLNNKTTIDTVDKGINYVGYRVWYDHRLLRKSSGRRIIRSYKYLSNLLAEGGLDTDYYMRVTASFYGLLSHSDSYGLKRKLNQLFLEAVAPLIPEGSYIEPPF